jgi:photosystem II stability/assembly factor-like uncharacterized protein
VRQHLLAITLVLALAIPADGAGWTSHPIPGGPALTVAVSPVDPNIVRVVAGDLLDSEAVPPRTLQSTDGGSSWVEVAHSGPAVFLAAAPGLLLRGMPEEDSSEDIVLERSVDGGLTWRPVDLGQPLDGVWVARDGGVVYVLRLDGTLVRSVDGAATFADASTPQQGTGVVAGSGPVAVAVDSDGVPVERTADAGASWQVVPPLPEGLALKSVDVGADGRLWAVVSEFESGVTRLLATAGTEPWATVGGRVDGDLLVADPFEADHLIVTVPGLGGGIESFDGGQSWTPVELLADAWGGFTFARDGHLWSAGFHGVARRAGGETAWTILDPGLVGHATMTAAFGAAGLVVGTRGGGIFSVPTAGVPVALGGAPVIGAIAIAPSRPARLYAIAGFFVFAPDKRTYISDDGGLTWHRGGDLPLNGGAIRVVVSPHDPDVALVGSFGAFLVTRDAGATWQPASSGMADGTTVTAVAFDPGNAAELMAGGFTGFLETEHAAYRSHDGGRSWRRIPPRQLHGADHLVRDPFDHRHLIATFRDEVYESRDRGASWRRGGGAGGHVVFHPTRRGVRYTLFDGGSIHRSNDDGRHWQRVVGSVEEVSTSIIGVIGPGATFVAGAPGAVLTWSDPNTDWSRPRVRGLALVRREGRLRLVGRVADERGGSGPRIVEVTVGRREGGACTAWARGRFVRLPCARRRLPESNVRVRPGGYFSLDLGPARPGFYRARAVALDRAGNVSRPATATRG